MSERDEFAELDGLVDAVASIFTAPAVFALNEVGIVKELRPLPRFRTISAAIHNTGEKVGLSSWALNPLYLACKDRLQVDPDDLVAATAILVVTPDFLTAWNVRKRAFTHDRLREEMHFSTLILTRSPKSAESWTHRHWVISSVGAARVDLPAEFAIAGLAASRERSNYYASVHRMRLLSNSPDDTVMNELEKNRDWLRTHMSDSSGWSFHRAVLSELILRSLASLEDERVWFQSVILEYGARYQSVNVHRKWLERSRTPTET